MSKFVMVREECGVVSVVNFDQVLSITPWEKRGTYAIEFGDCNNFKEISAEEYGRLVAVLDVRLA